MTPTRGFKLKQQLFILLSGGGPVQYDSSVVLARVTRLGLGQESVIVAQLEAGESKIQHLLVPKGF